LSEGFIENLLNISRSLFNERDPLFEVKFSELYRDILRFGAGPGVVSEFSGSELSRIQFLSRMGFLENIYGCLRETPFSQ